MKIPIFNIGNVVECIKQDGICRVGERYIVKRANFKYYGNPIDCIEIEGGHGSPYYATEFKLIENQSIEPLIFN